MREHVPIDWDGYVAIGERFFEAATEPEREREFPIGEIALALRLECWDHAFALDGVRTLARQLGTDEVQRGYIDRLNRTRMMGLAHLLLLQVAPYENEFRQWLADKMSRRG